MLGALDDARHQFTRTLRAVVGDDRVDRLEPLGGLDYVDVRGGVGRSVARAVVRRTCPVAAPVVSVGGMRLGGGAVSHGQSPLARTVWRLYLRDLSHSCPKIA